MLCLLFGVDSGLLLLCGIAYSHINPNSYNVIISLHT